MPSSRLTVRCGEPSVRARLQGWFDEMELPLPRPLTIDLQVGDAESVAVGSAPIFRQPEIAIHRGSMPGALTIRWEPVPAVAHVPAGVDATRVLLSPAAVAELDRLCRFFLSAVLIFMVRRVGWHHVHAATAVDPGGRGWMFAGDWQVGKSTTAALLASAGWGVGGDDVVFLTGGANGVETIARRGPIALRDGALALLGRRGDVFDPARGKTLFTPEELGGAWAQTIRPQVLIFPTVHEGATTIDSISPRDVLAELVRWSAWVALEPHLAQEHLDLLAAVGEQTQSYRMRLGEDLFEDPGLFLELIA